jgi:hypothetical protein
VLWKIIKSHFWFWTSHARLGSSREAQHKKKSA